jgi:GNAT superfamily N-acetyltransferase
VGLLSNLLGFRDGRADDDDALVIRQATAEDLEPAMRLILAPPGGTADARSVQEFIGFARERGIDFGGLHVAQRGGRLVSGILPVVSPGRTMLLLCPAGNQGKGTDAATAQLIDPVCHHGGARGIELAQTLIDPQDEALATLFTQGGFAKMAELHYLQGQPMSEASFPPLPDGMAWTAYSAESHRLFGRIILDSYQNSLDCPALNGRRDIDDIIAGHQASGSFDPNLWFLLRERETPLGVLLLSESLRSDSIELVYLGLTPGARGRGLAELMMRQAFASVSARNQQRLCLAVDSQNTPALKLYYRHGMHRIASKLALLRDLRKMGEKCAEFAGIGGV